MDHERHRWWASGLRPTAVLGVGAVLLALVGSVLHMAVVDTPLAERTYWLMGASAAVAYGIAATLLAARDAARVVRRLLAAVALAQGASLFCMEYAAAGLGGGTRLPLDEAAQWVGSWGWVPGYLLVLTVLPLVLPDGRLPSPRWRPAALLSGTAVVAATLWWAVLPYDAQDVPLAVGVATNPFALDAATRPVVTGLVAALPLAAGALALAGMVVRWRGAVGTDRPAVSWVMVGVLATAALAGAALLVSSPVGSEALAAAAMWPLPLGCAVAALRHGLWDVDVVLSRSLVYAALSGAVVAAYVAAVALLGAMLGGSAGAPVLATVLVALLVLPLHARLQRVVNRVVHGDGEDPWTALGRLGDRLEATGDPVDVAGRVLPELVAEVVRLLRVPWAAVELADGGRVAAGAEDGAPGDGLRTPLVFGGTEVGGLVVGITADLSRRERQLLDRLARQAAVAVHALLLARDLQRSRELVVTGREEERRRLRQDLHDGMGPSLAALALQAETARDLVTDDPAAAAALLDRLVPRLKTSVQEVRTLVYGLRPPALDALGLAGAVEELVHRFSAPSVVVTVDVRGDLGPGSLPAAVDVAAYRIIAEAMTNAARHAGARHVAVVLDRRTDSVLVEVSDDGSGIGPAPPRGLGLRSMEERAIELGGTVHVGSADGGAGTAVRARLPLAVGSAA